MPRIFNKLGIRFSFPDSWSLEEQDVEQGRTVSVASPDGAFWWLVAHPAGSELSDVAKAVLEGLRQTYDEVDIEAVREIIDGEPLVGYNVDFICLDMTNTAQIRAFQTERGVYVMLWQAEDRDFRQHEPVFHAITASLVRSVREEPSTQSR